MQVQNHTYSRYFYRENLVNTAIKNKKQAGVVNYRFGYQGSEKDNEISGEGNTLVFKYRIEDSRRGEFLSVDPLIKDYPYLSPYVFSEDRVIDGVELEGMERRNYSDRYKQLHCPVFTVSRGHPALNREWKILKGNVKDTYANINSKVKPIAKKTLQIISSPITFPIYKISILIDKFSHSKIQINPEPEPFDFDKPQIDIKIKIEKK